MVSHSPTTLWTFLFIKCTSEDWLYLEYHQMSDDGNVNFIIIGALCHMLYHLWHAVYHTLCHTTVTYTLMSCYIRATDLVLVSERSPVTLSTAVLNRTPFCSPMFKNNPPIDTGSAATPTVPSGAPWPISTMQSDSGVVGRACMLSG